MDKITASAVRYIKLGPANGWAQTAFDHHEIHFGYKTISHELCQSGDWEQATAILRAEGRAPNKASDAVREIRDFYSLGADCLWITFCNDRLWWVFAEPDVTWLGPDSDKHGSRVRKTIGPWRCTDIRDRTLRVDELSTRLTQVGAYRQTLCGVKDSDYLLRRINAEDEPLVQEAIQLRTTMLELTTRMIARLHWAEFETMVDLIFARSGWQRISRVGGGQKDVDLVLQQPTTGETAWVQVKSKARQAVLDDYVTRFRENGSQDRLFFVCHSPRGKMAVSDPDIHLWTGDTLAAAATKAGLFEWLIDRCG
ncbi:MAG: restriction endonuclease [Hyphomicrobiaceae bacterium]